MCSFVSTAKPFQIVRAQKLPSRTTRLRVTSRSSQYKVGILMGSPTDYKLMKPAEDVLKDFGIQTDTRVMSAHRQPQEVAQFAATARNKGYFAIICGAGMAAHLAGAVSSRTTLPVVGVPLSGSALSGMDALYATVQMPKGIPVATVAVDTSVNAGILVAQMIGAKDFEMAEKIESMRMNTRVAFNETKLTDGGTE